MLADLKRVTHTWGLLTIFFAVFLAVSGCSKAEEEPKIISKRMKITVPKEMAHTEDVKTVDAASGKEVAKETHAKAAKTAKKEAVAKVDKPKVKWVASKKKSSTTTKKTTKKKAVKKKDPRPETDKPYAIHVGSFKVKSQATKVIAKLVKGGYNAYLTEFDLKSVKWYRVRVGFYRKAAHAESIKKTLADKFDFEDSWITRPQWEEIDKFME